MKIYINTFIILIFAQLNAGTDLKWVDEQIDAIKPSRSGVSSAFINSLKDPIKLTLPKDDKKIVTSTSSGIKYSKPGRKFHSQPLTLEAIMNKNAYINGKWYSINDKVRGQKITLIDKNYVVLKYKKKRTRLFVNNKNKKIKITTR
jgi:hypothetical protein